MLMIGSNIEFGGRDKLFKEHGNYEIYDFNSAIEEGKKTKEDFVWWGFSDKDLFEYAKEKLLNFSEKEETFNLTMLTVDTHAVNGYYCEDCKDNFDEPYFKTLNCSSRRIQQFIEWVKEQDFYENTTIVLCGDHPSMQPTTFDGLQEKGYERTVLNIIINPAIEPENTKNKNASTMDMFPTTLASLGATIEGEKLGLGTNLFSDKTTLIGKYGLEYVEKELQKKSVFFEDKILYNN